MSEEPQDASVLLGGPDPQPLTPSQRERELLATPIPKEAAGLVDDDGIAFHPVLHVMEDGKPVLRKNGLAKKRQGRQYQRGLELLKGNRSDDPTPPADRPAVPDTPPADPVEPVHRGDDRGNSDGTPPPVDDPDAQSPLFDPELCGPGERFEDRQREQGRDFEKSASAWLLLSVGLVALLWSGWRALSSREEEVLKSDLEEIMRKHNIPGPPPEASFGAHLFKIINDRLPDGAIRRGFIRIAQSVGIFKESSENAEAKQGEDDAKEHD